MSLNDSLNEKIQKMTWLDIACVELGAFFLGLFVARIWLDVLNLEWYWYLIISLLLYLKPAKKML